jgi:hypothetical protein
MAKRRDAARARQFANRSWQNGVGRSWVYPNCRAASVPRVVMVLVVMIVAVLWVVVVVVVTVVDVDHLAMIVPGAGPEAAGRER